MFKKIQNLLKFQLFLLFFSPFFFNLYASSINELENELKNEFEKHYKSLFIQALSIRHQKPIDENDFLKYQFLNMELISYKNKGYFKANFNYKNTIKSLYFSYDLIASAYVLKAKNDLKKEQKIGLFDYQKIKLDINKIPKNALFELDSGLICKSNIKKNAILTKQMFKTAFLINKNDSVVAIAKDGELSVYVDMIAISSGNLGQKIKLKNKDGKIFYGIIKSSKNVLLLNF